MTIATREARRAKAARTQLQQELDRLAATGREPTDAELDAAVTLCGPIVSAALTARHAGQLDAFAEALRR